MMSHRTDAARRLSISLFLVNKTVSQEAQDAFLKCHTVLGGSLPIRGSIMPLIRNIEFRPGDRSFASQLNDLSGCSSKLKTVVLARENLYGWSSMRECLEWYKQDANLECLELGLWKLTTDADCNRDVFVKHFGLASALAEARDLVATNTLTMLNLNKQSLEQGGVAPESWKEAKAARLAWWLAAFEAFKAEEAGAVLTVQDKEIVVRWHNHFLRETDSIHIRQDILPAGIRLQDLSVAEHGAEVVEWATELLGMNMRERASKRVIRRIRS